MWPPTWSVLLLVRCDSGKCSKGGVDKGFGTVISHVYDCDLGWRGRDIEV